MNFKLYQIEFQYHELINFTQFQIDSVLFENGSLAVLRLREKFKNDLESVQQIFSNMLNSYYDCLRRNTDNDSHWYDDAVSEFQKIYKNTSESDKTEFTTRQHKQLVQLGNAWQWKNVRLMIHFMYYYFCHFSHSKLLGCEANEYSK